MFGTDHLGRYKTGFDVTHRSRRAMAASSSLFSEVHLHGGRTTAAQYSAIDNGPESSGFYPALTTPRQHRRQAVSQVCMWYIDRIFDHGQLECPLGASTNDTSIFWYIVNEVPFLGDFRVGIVIQRS